MPLSNLPASLSSRSAGKRPPRIPHAARHVKGWRYFAGLFGGEHIAATEFVIGVTFVMMGVGAVEVMIGLVIGNTLAVLSWALVTAPIAVETRQTLYAYAQRIVGPFATTIFNCANILYFGALAAAMITVSAFAVRFALDVPVQLNWYPDSPAFILIVAAIGAVVVVVASVGFESVADLATICAPWMLTCFICGAVAILPALVYGTTGTFDFAGFSGFLDVARESVWTGTTPDGEPGIGMLEVAAFAWANSAAFNLGLIDMAIFRFAKKPSYGFFSAVGMFLGHYVAWICAGLMGAGAALVIGSSLLELDAGDVAYYTLGLTGILVVMAAGWTTANACLYRAGLAASALFPSRPRWLVTMEVGSVIVVAACFPLIVQSVLPMTVYGSIMLIPLGAIVVAEHVIFPRIGLTRYWAHYRKLYLSVPAVGAWAIAILFAVAMDLSGAISFYYIFLPEYLVAIAAYTLLAYFFGAKQSYEAPQKRQYEEEQALANFEERRDAEEAEAPNVETPWLAKWLLIFAGAVLAAMVGTAIWVFVSGTDTPRYEANFAMFTTALVPLTFLYFLLAVSAMRVHGAQADKD